MCDVLLLAERPNLVDINVRYHATSDRERVVSPIL